MGENKKKILLFDIETTPIVGLTWGTYQTDVIKVLDDWHILCFAYKWLGEKETHVVALPDFKKRYAKDKKDDTDVCIALWNLFNEADVVIAHNGDSFDIKKSNARFIYHAMSAPSPYLSIDTKKVAKKYFKFTSNSLKELAKFLGVRAKADAGGIGTWIGCMNGEEKAWKHMTKYNIQDVNVLEDVYLALRPWMKSHPVTVDNGACPKCSKNKLQKRGFERTVSGIQYQRYQCQSCYGWSRSRLSEEVKSIAV